MVPFGLTQEQFSARYMRSIDRGSAHVIDELRLLINKPIVGAIKTAEVQIFFGDDGLDRPTAWIYYRGENNKVDRSDTSIFPGRSMQLSLGLESMDDFDENYFNDSSFNGLYIAANLVKSWLAECWWKAGGWVYSIPATVNVHDGFGDGVAIRLSQHR